MGGTKCFRAGFNAAEERFMEGRRFYDMVRVKVVIIIINKDHIFIKSVDCYSAHNLDQTTLSFANCNSSTGSLFVNLLR